jgi:replicative DNA helicase
MGAVDLAFVKGLPANVDVERFVLGSIQLNGEAYADVAAVLHPDDFSLEKHRSIFARMKDLYDRGEKIDRVTLSNELQKHGQSESMDGFCYLASLDAGLPMFVNLDSCIRIVKEKSTLRQTLFTCQRVMDRCLLAEDQAEDILTEATAICAFRWWEEDL